MRHFVYLLALVSFPAAAQSLLQPGMTVTTNFPADSVNDYVVHIFDTRDVVVDAPAGSNWSMNTLLPPSVSDQNQWKIPRMGSCFGTTIDGDGNIYVAATSCYGSFYTQWGSAGPGGIYRINANDWSTSDFITTTNSPTTGTATTIPNTGFGLGNITYDKWNNQLFATNCEDGKIYRISTGGTILSTFDPFAADNGVAGFAPFDEALYGIGVSQVSGVTRVYFSRWSFTWMSATGPPNTIWSVELDANGEFVGSEQLEFTVPDLPYPNAPVHGGIVTCINFSADGRMLAAERTMMDFTTPSAHESRVYILELQSGVWTKTTDIHVGVLELISGIGSNSAGGADFGYRDDDAGDALTGCEQLVWATCDAIKYTFYNPDGANEYVYGITGVKASGNSMDPSSPDWEYSTAYMVDFNNNITDYPKMQLGSCAVFRSCVYDPCEDYTCTMVNVITPNGDQKNDVLRVDCIKSEGWKLEIYNRWGNLLYSNDSYENDWSGAGYNDGVYYYIITSPCDGRKMNGFFHLLRNAP